MTTKRPPQQGPATRRRHAMGARSGDPRDRTGPALLRRAAAAEECRDPCHDQQASGQTRAAARRRSANVELGLGHRELALELFFEAAVKFAQAQHPIFETNDEKRFLHAVVDPLLRQGARARADRDRARRHPVAGHGGVREPAPGRGRGPSSAGVLHPRLRPDEGIRATSAAQLGEPARYAPVRLRRSRSGRVEHSRHPADRRQLRGRRKHSADLPARAVQRSTTDRTAVYAKSFGSYWGARFAATDHRLAACVLQSASVVDKSYQFGGAVSPRYKQLFVYLTRSNSEEEVDAFIDAMTLDDLVGEH